jgi:hypothetical protein
MERSGMAVSDKQENLGICQGDNRLYSVSKRMIINIKKIILNFMNTAKFGLFWMAEF